MENAKLLAIIVLIANIVSACYGASHGETDWVILNIGVAIIIAIALLK